LNNNRTYKLYSLVFSKDKLLDFDALLPFVYQMIVQLHAIHFLFHLKKGGGYDE